MKPPSFFVWIVKWDVRTSGASLLANPFPKRRVWETIPILERRIVVLLQHQNLSEFKKKEKKLLNVLDMFVLQL